MVNIKFFNDYLNFKDSFRNWEGTAQNKLMKRGRLLNFNVSLCVMCFLKLGFFIFCGGGHKRILKLPKPKGKAKRRFSFGFESARIQRILCFCPIAPFYGDSFNTCMEAVFTDGEMCFPRSGVLQLLTGFLIRTVQAIKSTWILEVLLDYLRQLVYNDGKSA